MEREEKREEFRLPKKGDRLMRDSEDWDRSTEFSQDSRDREVHIWTGFMKAGEELIDSCELNPHERHFLIYPILFNYRHGIEAAMKWIIARYGRYADIKLDDQNHRLCCLWALCKQIIGEEKDDEQTNAVERVIMDFHEMDQWSTSFRYALNKSGQLISLPEGSIDLSNVREVMVGVNFYFDGLDAWLDECASAYDSSV